MTRPAWMAVTFVALVAGGLHAQDFTPPDIDISMRNDVADMKTGRKPANDPEAKKKMETVARWVVYRLTQPQFHDPVNPTQGMSSLVLEGERYILDISRTRKLTDNDKLYIREYGSVLVARLRDIFGTAQKPGHTKVMVRIGAARMLASLGRSGYEQTIDLAAELIDNPAEHDAVKLFALKAIENLFTIPNATPGESDRSIITDPKRELRAIQSLLAFVQRKPALAPDASNAEIEAFRYIRREGLRTLGLVHRPVIRERDKTIVAEPAYVLMKFARATPDIQPAPNLAERAEGLIGFLQLEQDPQYHLDYAAGFIAATVGDLAIEYSQRTDRKKPEKEKDEKKDDKKPKPPTIAIESPDAGPPVKQADYLPWKLIASRIDTALKDWRKKWEDANPIPKDDQAKIMNSLVSTCTDSVLTPIMTYGLSSKVQPDGNAVYDWVKQQKYTGTSLLKDNPKTVLPNPFEVRPAAGG